ncbi:MAG: hypothetical protein NZ902_05255 [Acidilobaceae archaeon]|nr:hypothetical protein [Acidilobaceae archaeon]MCX8165974.1 hypothetical protein [Acidilobaceae archaeon]MDW7974617.1 hypothetical protein [Sulfolobales archaeon]
MELVFEIEPVKSREKLESRLRRLEGIADWIDIPDSPLGTALFSSPLASCMSKGISSLKVLSHIRVIDVNRIALEATLRGLALCGVEGVVFLRGDIVDSVTVIRDVGPEEAVRVTKNLGLPLLAGLTLSLRKSAEEIEARLRAGADIYLVLNLSESTLEKLESAVKLAAGKMVIPYLVLLSEKNVEKLRPLLGKTPLYSPEGALKLAEAIASLSYPPSGLLISSPGDFEAGAKFVEVLRKR